MNVNRRQGVVRELRTLFVSGTLGRLEDVQLLDRYVGENDEGAFETLVTRHGPMVWGVCKRVLGNHQDAEDAFQATFLILARRAPSIRPREMLGNWLYGVAYRTASKARSTRFKRNARETTVNELPEPIVGARNVHDDLGDRLDHELTRLPEKYRVPIILCDLQEKSHKDAAILLGWPIGTVSGRLSRGRTLLAKRLRRDEPTPSGSALALLLSPDIFLASLPHGLVDSTSKAAGLIALSRSATLGVVSTQVAVLTEGVLKSMFMTKIKIATIVVVSGFALFAGGTGISLIAKAAPGPRQDSGEKAEVLRDSAANDRVGAPPRAHQDEARASKPKPSVGSPSVPDAPPPSESVSTGSKPKPSVGPPPVSDAPPPSESTDPRLDSLVHSPLDPIPAATFAPDDTRRLDNLPAKLVDRDRAVVSENVPSLKPKSADSPLQADERRAVGADRLGQPGTLVPLNEDPDDDAVVSENVPSLKPKSADSPLQADERRAVGADRLGQPGTLVPLNEDPDDDLEDVELAIAAGVNEAMLIAAKSPKEVDMLVADLKNTLREERLKIRQIQACLRRLARIREKRNPRTGGSTQFEGKPSNESQRAVLER